MRARNIKPGFFINEELAEVDASGRILFIGLWCLADREGKLEDRPKRIKGELFRYDPLSFEAIDELLSKLSSLGLITRYSVNGNSYIIIPTFLKHQSPHYNEKPSIIPDPLSTKDESTCDQGQQHNSLNPDSLNPDIRNPDSLNPDILKKKDSAAPPLKIIDPVAFECTYFKLKHSSFIKLRTKAKGMTDEAFGDLLDRVEMYVADHPKKYSRQADGTLANPSSVISKWLANEIIPHQREPANRPQDRTARNVAAAEAAMKRLKTGESNETG